MTTEQWYAALAAFAVSVVIPFLTVVLQRTSVWLTGHLGAPTGTPAVPPPPVPLPVWPPPLPGAAPDPFRPAV